METLNARKQSILADIINNNVKALTEAKDIALANNNLEQVNEVQIAINHFDPKLTEENIQSRIDCLTKDMIRCERGGYSKTAAQMQQSIGYYQSIFNEYDLIVGGL